MEQAETVVGVFPDHAAAEAAVMKLTASGFAMQFLSVVGKGYHAEEKVVGFYSTGDRIKFWGGRGAFWGGLWGLFFGGLFLTVPVIAFENAVLVGGLSALGAALYSIGIPKDRVIDDEAAVKVDGFLVMAQGAAAEIASAKAILQTTEPSTVEIHDGIKAAEPAFELARAEA